MTGGLATEVTPDTKKATNDPDLKFWCLLFPKWPHFGHLEIGQHLQLFEAFCGPFTAIFFARNHVHFQFPANTTPQQTMDSLNKHHKKGCKNGSGHVVTCFTTVMTCGWNCGLNYGYKWRTTCLCYSLAVFTQYTNLQIYRKEWPLK